MRNVSTAVGLVAGLAADAVFGDPARLHPVAGFGRVASTWERHAYADGRAAGVGFTAVLVVGTAAAGAVLQTCVRRSAPRAVLMAIATWTVLGGASLRSQGVALADELDRDDLVAARRRLPSLCGREAARLDAADLTRAGLESVAENTADAVVAPLFWGAVAGLPGLLGYRAVNTLDAMVGHRSPRYRHFGWAAARLDDAANLVPARLTALLVAALAPAVGGSGIAALRTWLADGRHHPSPNAGPVEASVAGALGVRLGGPTTYGQRTEDRPFLGGGGAPGVADLRRAVRLSGLVGLAAGAVMAGLALVRR